MCTHICTFIYMWVRKNGTRIVATGKNLDKTTARTENNQECACDQFQQKRRFSNCSVCHELDWSGATERACPLNNNKTEQKEVKQGVGDSHTDTGRPLSRSRVPKKRTTTPNQSQQDTTVTPQYQTYQEIYSIKSCSKIVLSVCENVRFTLVWVGATVKLRGL